MKVIETDRLTLRQLVVADAEELYRMQSGSEMMRFLGGDSPTVEKIRELIGINLTKLHGTGLGMRAAILKETGRMVGRCGLFYSDINGKREVELAYLIDRKYWGQGLATEASVRILEDGFGELRFDRIMAVISPENAASIRVAEKLGFRYQHPLADHKDFGAVSVYSIERGWVGRFTDHI